jgi:hypothetical protein
MGDLLGHTYTNVKAADNARVQYGDTYINVKAADTARVQYGDTYYYNPIKPNSDQTLDFGRHETRFLSVDSIPPIPGVPARISCDLTVRSLFECPEYIALSYSWGDHGSTRPILLDGVTTDVTASLEAALTELAARRVEAVWVDALCIDQKNNYEKVYQLRHMGTIFSQAVKVVAWLGPAADDSDNAMEALSKMREVDNVDCHGPAIMQLLKRPYWERVWIIQELAKASSVEVWCGTQMLPWDTFIEGVQKWWSNSKLRVGHVDHPVFTLKHFCDAERDIRRGTARMLLITAMVRTLHTKATLKRDRIYALLGITRDGAETISMPNYVQSDAHVFKSVFQHMIVEQGQLDLILLAGLGRKRADSPSWLPEWDDRMPLQASPWIKWCFENFNHEESVIACHDNVLRVSGQILGQLRPQTSAWTAPDAQRLSLCISHVYEVAQQLRMCGTFDSVANHASRRRRHRVTQHVLPRETWSRVLCAFWSSTAVDDRARCPNLRRWFEENADVLYDKTTLRSSVKQISKHLHHRESPYASLTEPELLDIPVRWKLLGDLEESIALMMRHGFKTQTLDHCRLVIVPASAETLDFVAHVANCSLPVVLRKSGDDIYSVVGEVVDILAWDQQGPSELTKQAGFGAKLQPKAENMEWRTLHLI